MVCFWGALWWGVALLSCALDASLPRGVSVGCSEAFTLSVTMGTSRGKEHNLYFCECCVIVLSQCDSEGAWRTTCLCPVCFCMTIMHTHALTHTGTHPPGSSACRRVCVCVCECYLNKKERKWIRVVSILIVKQISTKHFEKVNDLRIITIYYSASQGGSWRSPDGYKNGI